MQTQSLLVVIDDHGSCHRPKLSESILLCVQVLHHMDSAVCEGIHHMSGLSNKMPYRRINSTSVGLSSRIQHDPLHSSADSGGVQVLLLLS